MNYRFVAIDSNQLGKFYREFPAENAGAQTFLQSEAYGHFREKVGESVLRYGIFSDDRLIGTALIQHIKTRFKNFLHCPHGPLILKNNTDAWSFFLTQYINLGREKSADFVRVSPLIQNPQPLYPGVVNDVCTDRFQMCGFRPAPVHLVNPEHSLILDITPSEEEILAQMKKSTRYEIRQIKKYQLEVKMGNSAVDLDGFWQLHLATVARQGFTPFPRKNTEAQLEAFGSDCQIFSTFFAQNPSVFHASAIIIFDHHAAYYHQGASLLRKEPVAYAGLWAAILEAKKRGIQYFNFWGIVDDEQKKHPWYGLSRFKRGFGGTEYRYVHAHDFPLTKKYWLNWVLETWRKWRRGY